MLSKTPLRFLPAPLLAGSPRLGTLPALWLPRHLLPQLFVFLLQSSATVGGHKQPTVGNLEAEFKPYLCG